MTALEHAARWPAPAKLNLFLHVLGRRADGYHEIETAFQLIDLCDELRIATNTAGRIERLASPPGIPFESDLCLRAAHALRAAVDRPELGAAIALEKRIPIGGGLGGGSSDAATVLLVLDLLWGLDLGLERLCEVGLGLGADVPVFVRGETAFAQGVGERITPIALPQRYFLVLDPGQHVATGEVFQAPDLTRDSAPITIPRLLDPGATRNDLEAVVRRRYPAVAAALEWLAEFAPARLTGSGGCVFAVFDARPGAEAAALRCPPQWRAFVARGLAHSPLRASLEAMRAKLRGGIG
jgi:4-diphosphocytidyl-2-C-methyl-D-erythritol kinase